MNEPLDPIRWLQLSAVLFSIAIYGMMTRRNAVGVLMCVEIALNSAALNFVILNRYYAGPGLDGQVMALFVIAVAAAEAVVAIAIFILLYRQSRTVDVNEAGELKL